MITDCTKCGGVLERSGELKRRCTKCATDFTLHVACSTCGDEIERLKACGAVSFWCNTCNELKSKSGATYTLQDAS